MLARAHARLDAAKHLLRAQGVYSAAAAVVSDKGASVFKEYQQRMLDALKDSNVQ
jgi:hypothetical protein